MLKTTLHISMMHVYKAMKIKSCHARPVLSATFRLKRLWLKKQPCISLLKW